MATAIREYRTTALTRAFFLGAVILPVVIWGIMLAVTAVKFEEPPLEGTLAVIDRTDNAFLGPALTRAFDIEEQKKRDAEMKARIEAIVASQMGGAASKPQIESAMRLMGIGQIADLKIDAVGPDADEAALRERVVAGEYEGLIIVDEATIGLGAAEDEKRGTYQFIQPTELRPSHADKIKSAVQSAVRTERFARAKIDPVVVDSLNALRVSSESIVITDRGEKKTNDKVTRVLPILFFFLVYMGSMYGGSYLFYGTLEEKSSRVVEVLLSAVSVKELLLGKFLGQGLVGLTVLVVYGALGLAVASRFPGVGDQIPMHLLPWVIVYFLIAYGMFGALMLAVGSAVSEIREAQALFTPITMLIVVVYVSIFPVMQNPGSVVSRILSFFPPTTPFVMVMRLSQPSHIVPMWERFATMGAGILGVAIAFWAAAKVFRVGILMYGKPPTLMTLWKWIRYA
jgi:ABC-2 type transport system permease protein